MGLFGDLAHRAAKIDINDTHLVLVDKSSGDLRQGGRVIVPNLYGQWSWFLLDAPQPIGMFGLMFIEPDKPPGIDHFGGEQASATKLSDNLPKGVIRETGHRRLKKRRIDLQWADPQWSNAWQAGARGRLWYIDSRRSRTHRAIMPRYLVWRQFGVRSVWRSSADLQGVGGHQDRFFGAERLQAFAAGGHDRSVNPSTWPVLRLPLLAIGEGLSAVPLPRIAALKVVGYRRACRWLAGWSLDQHSH